MIMIILNTYLKHLMIWMMVFYKKRNIKVKLLNKTITIRGNLDGRDLLLFKYFGEFQPLSARNSITKKKVNLTPTSLTYWGLDVGIWDDDTTLWGDKDITYTHIKKIKRKLL